MRPIGWSSIPGRAWARLAAPAIVAAFACGGSRRAGPVEPAPRTDVIGRWRVEWNGQPWRTIGIAWNGHQYTLSGHDAGATGGGVCARQRSNRLGMACVYCDDAAPCALTQYIEAPGSFEQWGQTFHDAVDGTWWMRGGRGRGHELARPVERASDRYQVTGENPAGRRYHAELVIAWQPHDAGAARGRATWQRAGAPTNVGIASASNDLLIGSTEGGRLQGIKVLAFHSPAEDGNFEGELVGYDEQSQQMVWFPVVLVPVSSGGDR
jgi:hypothetical protein